MINSASTMRHDETALTVAGAPDRRYRAGPAAGPVLVLLHGGDPDSAQAAWAPVWPALTPHARLVAPDLPGCGGSPSAPPPRPLRAATLRRLRALLVLAAALAAGGCGVGGEGRAAGCTASRRVGVTGATGLELTGTAGRWRWTGPAPPP